MDSTTCGAAECEKGIISHIGGGQTADETHRLDGHDVNVTQQRHDGEAQLYMLRVYQSSAHEM